MATSSIPNLNILRRERGAIRGGRANRSGAGDKDAIIRSTDVDASTSRLSAIEAGYLDDPFAKYLSNQSWQPRLPLMNRGTYVRTTAIDRVVDTFLSSVEGQKQIISLGAGSDTRYFRLSKEKQHANFVYHELDFQQNNELKIGRLTQPECVQAIRQLCGVDLETAEVGDGQLTLKNYHIHSIDLRNLPQHQDWLETSIPTLLISECCLIYLAPDQAVEVLSYFSGMFAKTSLAIVIYEPFRPHDPFGRTMIKNLTTRGIDLQTIEKYSDLEQQLGRLESLRFNAHAADTSSIWRSWIDQTEKGRIDKLEWLDEIEEFELLARHYCVAWGWREFQNETLWKKLIASI